MKALRRADRFDVAKAKREAVAARCEWVSLTGDVNIPWSLPIPEAGGKNERRNAVGLVSRRSNQIAVCVRERVRTSVHCPVLRTRAAGRC